MAKERVLLVLEAWKETWALRMLGRCYRMCILLFTEKRFIELETNVLEKVVPDYTTPGVGVTEINPLDLLWALLLNVLIEVVWEKTGMKTRIWARKREREEAMKALSGDDLDEVLRFIRGYLAPRMKVREMREGLVAYYAELDRVKARKNGSTLRLEVARGGRKLRYEIPFFDEESARLVKERLGALGLPNLEVR